MTNYPAKGMSPWFFSASGKVSIYWRLRGKLSHSSGPNVLATSPLRECVLILLGPQALSGLASSIWAWCFLLGLGRQSHLPYIGQNGFEASGSQLLGFLQPPSLCHLLVLCTNALAMIHLVRHKRVKGGREPRVPGLQWLDKSGGSKIQANHHHHLAPALPVPLFLMEIKWMWEEISGLLWAEFICLFFFSLLALPLPLGSHIFQLLHLLRNNQGTVSSKDIFPFIDYMGSFVLPLPFGYHVSQAELRTYAMSAHFLRSTVAYG